MILSFDKFERYEIPQVTLCNPNSRATEVDGRITITDTVGVLSNPKGMSLKLNFNAPYELSFDYYRHKSTDPIKQSFYDNIYEAIQTDRYVYLTDIGYFIISNVSDSDEDNIDKKSISLKSCEENELAVAEGLYLEEGTYYLHTDNNDGLLDLFLPKTAGWTIGYIDPSLLTKPYYVEDTEVDNGYNFLYTTVQNMFECIVEPDIIKRTISVYSRIYYAEHHLTDIHIAKYNLLKHRVIEENDEDKYTALNVQGKDENLEIRAVNPTGKNVIYDFDPRYSWMSSALQQAIEKWQEKCESVEDEYLTLQQGYYNDMQNIVFPLEKDIETLELQLKQKEQTRDSIVYGEYDKEQYETQQNALDSVNNEIKSLTTQINTSKSNLNNAKNNIENNYLKHITQINKDCALDLTAKDINGNMIFTTALLNELMTHIKPTDYVDEYMLVTESMTYPQRFEKAKELMKRAKSQLVKISSGKKTYSVDTRSFLFNKHFKHFSEQLCAGAIIYVETKKDIMEQLHLTGIDINFDDKSANLTLGNKYDRSDLKALYEDALGQYSKSFTELKYIASIIEDQQKQLDYQRNWVADLRTLTLNNVLTSEDQAIEINNRGLIGRKRQLNADGSWKEDKNGNPLFELEQVKLINNILIFTKDNWEHAETAVGKIAVGYNSDGSVKYDYGMNGRVIIGELFLGNNLVLTGTSAGIKIKDKNGNNAFYADDNGNLTLSGKIIAVTGKIGGWDINSDRLICKKDDNNFVTLHKPSDWTNMSDGKGDVLVVRNGDTYPFSLFADGSFIATKANITGTITASSGQIGGWDITNNFLGKFTPTDPSQRFFLSQNGYASHTEASGNTQNWLMDLGGKFAVNTNGQMYATDATIKGTVTATSGQIGGWNISTNRIYNTNSTTGYTFSLWNPSEATSAIITCNNGSDYPFYVTRDGFLKANNANIKGTITATSGKIGGWTITTSGALTASTNPEGYINHAVYMERERLIYMYNQSAGDGRIASWADVILAGQNASDKNLKENINVMDCNFDKFFDSLKPVSFNYKREAMCGSSNEIHLGFVAQEVEESAIANDCYSSAIVWKDDYYKINKQEFIALNTWQIQKLKKRASAAEIRITNLEATVAELKTQIQTLTAG